MLFWFESPAINIDKANVLRLNVLDLVTFVGWHQENMTVAVFLDMRRFFGTVSHAHVSHGLLKLGVQERMLRWLSEFPQGRTISYTQLTERVRSMHFFIGYRSVVYRTRYCITPSWLNSLPNFIQTYGATCTLMTSVYGLLVHLFPSFSSRGKNVRMRWTLSWKSEGWIFLHLSQLCYLSYLYLIITGTPHWNSACPSILRH